MNQIIEIIKRKITELAPNRETQEELENALLDEITKKYFNELSQEIEELRNQNDKYFKRHKEIGKDIERLDNDLINSDRENTELKARISSLEDENRELQAIAKKNRDLESSLKEEKKRNIKLENEVTTLRMAKMVLEASQNVAGGLAIGGYKAEKAEKEEIKKKLKEEEKKTEDLKTAKEDLRKLNEEIIIKLNKLNSDNKELETNLEISTNSLAIQEERNETLSATLEDKKKS